MGWELFGTGKEKDKEKDKDKDKDKEKEGSQFTKQDLPGTHFALSTYALGLTNLTMSSSTSNKQQNGDPQPLASQDDFNAIKDAIAAGDAPLLQQLIQRANQSHSLHDVERTAFLKQILSVDDVNTFILAKTLIKNTKNSLILIKSLATDPTYLAWLTFLAAAHDDLDLMKDCLRYRGANQFALGPMLWVAATNGHEPVVRYLLDDMNVSPDELVDNDTNEALNKKPVLQRVREVRDQKNDGCIKLLTAKSENAVNELFSAVEKGNESSVNMLLLDGVSLQAKLDYMTLIGAATQHHQEKIVALLVEKGANPDEEIWIKQPNNEAYTKATAYSLAYFFAKNKINAKCLMQIVPQSQLAESEIRDAIKKGQVETVDFLLEHGFAVLVDERKLIEFAVAAYNDSLEENDQALLKTIIKKLFPYSLAIKKSMSSAAEKGDVASIAKVLTFGFDANTMDGDQQTLLYIAVKQGYGDLVKILLDAGADPDIKTKGQSALEFARTIKNRDIIRLLTPKSKQAITELSAAAEQKQREAVQNLLNDGVDPIVVMLEALEKEQVNAIESLLVCNFDPDTPLQGGKSALQIAREKQKADCVKCLIVKSKASITELQGKVSKLSSNAEKKPLIDAAEKLLAEGVDSACLSDGQRKLLKEHKGYFGSSTSFNFVAEKHPHLAKIVKEDCDQQIKQWNEGKEEIHPIITDLDVEIERLKQDGLSSQDARSNFVSALAALRDNLCKQINKQRNVWNPTSRSVKVAGYTINMLVGLREPKEANVDQEVYNNARIKILTQYENDCKKTSAGSKFLRILGAVCFAAVGFIVGGIIGMGIGIALGAWSGPGAFVTAAVGLCSGAATGATIGVTAGASGVALSTFALSGGLMFKPWRLRKEAGAVAEVGRRYVKAT